MERELPKVSHWIFNYEPKWEAASMEVEALSTHLENSFNIQVISMNLKNQKIALRGKYKYLPLPYALIGLPLVRSYAASFQINHLFASPGESLLLSRLTRLNTLLTITKDTNSLRDLEKNIDHLKKLRCIVVESQWHRELLRQLGIKDEAVKLVYPGRKIKPYQTVPEPFRILFATSPRDSYDFLTRGIYLLLKVARLLPQVRFILVWREHHYQKLCKLLESAEIDNVEILNGYIPDMDKIYQSVHATILPGLTTNSLKPCPHSALDSLAHGKPVLVSQPTSIARLVQTKGSGIMFEPTTDSLHQAIIHLIENYDLFQNNCHTTISDNFSEVIFLERYHQIYNTIL